MGRGGNTELLIGPETAIPSRLTPASRPPEVTAPIDVAALAPPSHDEPGGPEITEAEFLEFARTANLSQWQIDTGLALVEDPSLVSEAGQFSALIFPPRRSLEAALAIAHGVPVEDYKLANAGRSWAELAREAEAMKLGPMRGDARLSDLALDAEQYFRGHERYGAGASSVKAPASASSARSGAFGEPDNFTGLEEHLAKLGPGARSGKVEDYSRAELRKLLGFLERECKHLSDEDLRGMALDGHLVPRLKGAPSHAVLAARSASRWGRGFDRYRGQEFRKAMRQPYGELARQFSDGDSPAAVLESRWREHLAEAHPFMAPMLEKSQMTSLRGSGLKALAERNGIATSLSADEINTVADGATTKLMTPLELSYSEAFNGFADQFGGARKLGNIRDGLTNKRGRRLRGCVAYYSPDSGDIHINTAYAKKLRGKDPSPAEIETTVSTMAHELFHAIEGRDDGSNRTGSRNTLSPEHTLDEGATEALARLHTQDLAERMGLWKRERGNLREHADGGSYPSEVETTLALAALCCDELDREKLREGGYAEPEALSEKAQNWLRDLHVKHGPDRRMELIAENLHQKRGLGESEASAEVSARQLLTICKKRKTQWSRLVTDDGNGGTSVSYKSPDTLGAQLDAWLKENGL